MDSISTRSRQPLAGAPTVDRQLADLIYQNSLEAIMVTDEQNAIVEINPAFSQITGYEAHEVVGRDASILDSPHHSREFYGQLRHTLSTSGEWQGELWSRRKNGSSFAGWLSINTAWDPVQRLKRRVTLFSDITSRKEFEALLWQQANFDALTQLPNLGMLRDRLAQELKKADRDGRKLALLAINLDRFRSIESLGQDEADWVLIEVARRLEACVRVTDTVARTSGDNFVALLTGLDNVVRATHLAQNMLQQIAQPFELDTALVALSASIGIAVYPGDDAEDSNLLPHAQQAMQSARQQGGNRYSFYTPSLQKAAQERTRMVHQLRTAIAERQFVLHFQPIVELASGRIRKAEALVRWNHPERGLIGPDSFIALAEEAHLIGEIGDWVFKEAARWALRWRQILRPTFQVSINKSPAQFLRRPDHARAWIDHLHGLGLPGHAVAIEITEGLLLNATPEIGDCLRQYRAAGIEIALDDFGTGYSSIAYLKKFAPDCIKIDQSFVRQLPADHGDLALCQAIVAMAHALGHKVVAEGIETEQQRDVLLGMGCHYGQGYLFSRPVAPEAFEVILARDLRTSA